MKNQPPDNIINENDRKLVNKIKKITSRGNDAEVRRKTDGSLAVYEGKKSAV